LALCQPAANEYQRFPGHPATTCLSTIFGGLPNFAVPPSAVAMTAPYATNISRYYELAPRIVAGGSVSGTTIPKPTKETDSAGRLIPDSDRLYASIDELAFTPAVKADGAGAKRRIANTSTTYKPGVITRQALERSKFFITASSNAPEVTLFNTPRIGVWPVY